MWIGDRIFFLADHEGIGNIYSCALDGSDVRRHTHESEYYVRFPSTDGKRIVYSAGAEIGLLRRRERHRAPDRDRDALADAADGAPLRERLRIARALRAAARTERSSPSISRGQAFTMPLFEGAAIRHGDRRTARARA